MAELATAWMLKRLIIAYRVEGWSGEVADKKLDSKTRYPDVLDDRVYGVDSENEVIEYLRLLPKYDQRHKSIKRRG
ncbi:hypothetical protein FTO70_12300 [Methanosarcina sp. KYL-1]|uniref:hypothetical protein n=1 Tax=Methanosarcina sp. KYL-1 TaxID=2602068 RepID=UPI002100E6A5|nr:hypothetical protein [Methanosarcina sp. KYL-1]MCQ1536441.1 hypothetical protein [Methanosarcina sp. KYL-1]